jgi:hypothetical protein
MTLSQERKASDMGKMKDLVCYDTPPVTPCHNDEEDSDE